MIHTDKNNLLQHDINQKDFRNNRKVNNRKFKCHKPVRF